MKFKPGTIVFARLPGHTSVAEWWPGQIADPTMACDEALYKQLPGHSLVCLYGNHKVMDRQSIKERARSDVPWLLMTRDT